MTTRTHPHYSVRMSAAQKQKVIRLGGAAWLKAAIDAAPDPDANPDDLHPSDPTPGPWALEYAARKASITAKAPGRTLSLSGKAAPGDAAAVVNVPAMLSALRQIAAMRGDSAGMAPWCAREALAQVARDVPRG